MTAYPTLPGDFMTPAYTHGLARQMYETHNLERRRQRPAAHPHPFTTAEGMRKVDFASGSFEVYL